MYNCDDELIARGNRGEDVDDWSWSENAAVGGILSNNCEIRIVSFFFAMAIVVGVTGVRIILQEKYFG